jgi:hypothetical protein
MNGFWTPDKESVLVRLYPDMKNVDIARRLGTTAQAIEMKAWRLKLKKTDAHNFEMHKISLAVRRGLMTLDTPDIPLKIRQFRPLVPAPLPDFISQRMEAFRSIPSYRPPVDKKESAPYDSLA